jgi:hypothetical protein
MIEVARRDHPAFPFQVAASSIKPATRRCTGSTGHGLFVTKWFNAWSCTPSSRAAIGWIDLRLPSSINPAGTSPPAPASPTASTTRTIRGIAGQIIAQPVSFNDAHTSTTTNQRPKSPLTARTRQSTTRANG